MKSSFRAYRALVAVLKAGLDLPMICAVWLVDIEILFITCHKSMQETFYFLSDKQHFASGFSPLDVSFPHSHGLLFPSFWIFPNVCMRSKEINWVEFYACVNCLTSELSFHPIMSGNLHVHIFSTSLDAPCFYIKIITTFKSFSSFWVKACSP